VQDRPRGQGLDAEEQPLLGTPRGGHRGAQGVPGGRLQRTPIGKPPASPPGAELLGLVLAGGVVGEVVRQVRLPAVLRALPGQGGREASLTVDAGNRVEEAQPSGLEDPVDLGAPRLAGLGIRHGRGHAPEEAPRQVIERATVAETAVRGRDADVGEQLHVEIDAVHASSRCTRTRP